MLISVMQANSVLVLVETVEQNDHVAYSVRQKVSPKFFHHFFLIIAKIFEAIFHTQFRATSNFDREYI